MVCQLPVKNVTMRRAIATDVTWAVPLMFSGGPALFSYVFASPSEQAQKVLQKAFIQPKHAFSYEHGEVIEVGGQPAGLMISYPGFRKLQADEKVQFVMARILPLQRVPKILVNVADFSRIKQDVCPQDYYIFTIGVLPEFRCLGLGSYLLAQAEAKAQSFDCQTINLDVTYINTRAQRLFEQYGYRTVCSKTSDRFQQMTRAGGIHRMVKCLREPEEGWNEE